MENYVKTHPGTTKAALGAFAVYVFDLVLRAFGAVDGIWSFFSSTSPYQWFTERWPGMTPETYWWAKLAIHLCMLMLLVKIFFTIRRQIIEEKEYKSLRNTNTELQKKLSAIEDIRPHLIVEPISVRRTIERDQQPLVLEPGLRLDFRRAIPAFFALLRITNKPESRNKNAIAHRLHASVSYCDSEWKELFPAPACTWVSVPLHTGKPHVIGHLSERAPSLMPYAAAYLGIAMGQVSPSDTLLYAALTTTSQRCPKWIHSDFILSERVPNKSVNVRVTIGCHGFRATHYFRLKDCGLEKGLQLEPTEKPNTE